MTYSGKSGDLKLSSTSIVMSVYSFLFNGACVLSFGEPTFSEHSLMSALLTNFWLESTLWDRSIGIAALKICLECQFPALLFVYVFASKVCFLHSANNWILCFNLDISFISFN